MNRGTPPVLVTVSGYTVPSPTFESNELGVPVTLHSGKLPIVKSESVAVGDCDERVSAIKVAKQPSRPNAVRSMPSSRNSPAIGLELLPLSLNVHGTLTGPLLTITNVLPGMPAPPLSGTSEPVASLPVQRNTL